MCSKLFFFLVSLNDPVRSNLLVVMGAAVILFVLTAVSCFALAGCAGMMRTGEHVIRTLTPDSGLLNSIGTFAADVHRDVRGAVFDDTTLVNNDPAKKKN